MNFLLSFVPSGTPFSQTGVQRYDFFRYFQIFLQLFYNFFFKTESHTSGITPCESTTCMNHEKQVKSNSLKLPSKNLSQAETLHEYAGCHQLRILLLSAPSVHRDTIDLTQHDVAIGTEHDSFHQALAVFPLPQRSAYDKTPRHLMMTGCRIRKWQLPTLPPGGAVPSAMVSLTSLFGMGRGGSSPL